VVIEAGSMQILVEQLRRNDTLQLAAWLQNRPEIDQRQLIEMVIDAFNVGIGHDLFSDDVNTDAISAANLEHQFFMLGQQVPALNGQDHKVHNEQHQMWMQQQMPQLVPPAMLQQVAQIAQQHLQMHAQMLQQQGQMLGGRAGGGSGAAARASAGGGPKDIQSTVNSNAQRISQAAEVSARAS
jgi:hypothetical protein